MPYTNETSLCNALLLECETVMSTEKSVLLSVPIMVAASDGEVTL